MRWLGNFTCMAFRFFYEDIPSLKSSLSYCNISNELFISEMQQPEKIGLYSMLR